MRGWVLVLLAHAACGRLGYDSALGDGGAPETDGAQTDARLPLGQFSQPTRLDDLDTGQFDDSPALTADLLEIYFDSANSATDPADLFRSTRATVDDPWAAPQPVTELNTSAHDGDAHISADGLTLYFASDRDGPQNDYDLFVTTRQSRLDPWDPPVVVPEFSGDQVDATPSIGAGGQRMVTTRFALSLSLASADLYEAERLQSGGWAPAAPIDELNTNFGDGAPELSIDGLVLYFYSDKPGGVGSIDFYVAQRPTLDAPFGTPVPLAELNTSAREEDLWLSPDERTIVFVRAGDLYEATR